MIQNTWCIGCAHWEPIRAEDSISGMVSGECVAPMLVDMTYRNTDVQVIELFEVMLVALSSLDRCPLKTEIQKY